MNPYSGPKAPPIKSQGIKTKLVPFIRNAIRWDGSGRWVEPFAGSGAVALNLLPDRALLADANPHLVRVYQDIQRGSVTAGTVTEFLTEQGNILRATGEAHYYAVRDRFNRNPSSLDFLFLNRACFNGMIRFNKKGGFNVPFCRKLDRFRQAYVTKIANQVKWAAHRIQLRDYVFKVQDWRDTLREVQAQDFVYIDPPYVGRHTDYFNSWDDDEADALSERIIELSASFALSNWLKNQYRENTHIMKWFAGYPMRTRSHFYHIGSFEELRNEMTEVLILSKDHDMEAQESEISVPGERQPALL